MKKYFTKFLLVFCFYIVFSCSETEVKTNPVFEKYLPETKQYKDELVKQLDTIDKSKLSYYFDSYEEINGLEYLHVTIEGKNLKADAIIQVKNWDDKIEIIRKFKGKGYGGAEMINLRFDIEKDTAKTEFIYAGVDELVD
ncbi:hypothetical protein [uncultured Flavobacterium sp.]|uniref:hypothetical protein n=1 Tax=uncultured Flavobacterium sp. TaxID=165435 RepID=UPI0025F673FC|nr:hypothetical protein [uncultured Flavobacterium sp.]